ncbi:hypothetical protein C440_09437 [Haloferax mucosum ATCC BAA-1512]|uniref:Sjogrens syndrome scleroderma autoantigen 1 n=1 Tax=Haloferax mucosum ATCC BAA-1512 TaxID=662479 RepID=M0IET7_9EURY|nr:Sjogren's syndrome/scleroderma autoantigen 1 family protein [Haloferax mucosum]ELZ95290.1 hypothetical protein C440_09437 [Haloferax mucosum ATCC BAA-1512]
MSDFDKEAERQRLREKYERDEAKRRSTQRMSELLLQGATMTNKHCDQCGDPLFRYEGQVFCPTCQSGEQAAASEDKPADTAQHAENAAESSEATAEGAAGTTAEGSGAAVEDATGANGRVTAASDPEDVGRDATDAGVSKVNASDAEAAEVDTSGSDVATGGVPEADAAASTRGKTETAGSQEPRVTDRPTRRVSTSAHTAGTRETTEHASRDIDGDVSSARASLVRTLTWAAEKAESTDDPRQVIEYLEVAREAAETIDALDR